jgi:pimeloyl-ACP methyl ester carboxylesterase
MPSLFYRKLGKGHPIILIHGFCETHEIWNSFADKLAEKFEVFAIDLPGFGASPMLSAPFSMEDVAACVTDWIDQVNLKLPIVIGHSLGGYVTLALAKKSPEKLAGIGLFHSTAYPDSAERKANRDRVIEFVKAHGAGPFIDTFVPGLFFDKSHPAISEAFRIARKTHQETVITYAAAMRDRLPSTDLRAHFQRPVLVLGGEEDPIVSAEVAREHAGFFYDADIHILGKVGHMAMFESPKESLKIVEEFVLKTIAKSLQ